MSAYICGPPAGSPQIEFHKGEHNALKRREISKGHLDYVCLLSELETQITTEHLSKKKARKRRGKRPQKQKLRTC